MLRPQNQWVSGPNCPFADRDEYGFNAKARMGTRVAPPQRCRTRGRAVIVMIRRSEMLACDGTSKGC